MVACCRFHVACCSCLNNIDISLKPKAQVLNVATLNNAFKDNDIVNPKTLLKAGIIDNMKKDVKILGNGELKIKNLTFEKINFSNSAKEQILKLKGKKKCY